MRGVAQPGQPLREEADGGGEADWSEGTDVGPLYAQSEGVETSQEGGAGWRTPRLGVETGQTDSLSPQLVQVGGGHGGVVPGHVIVTHVVTHQQQEVGRPPLLCGRQT